MNETFEHLAFCVIQTLHSVFFIRFGLVSFKLQTLAFFLDSDNHSYIDNSSSSADSFRDFPHTHLEIFSGVEI